MARIIGLVACSTLLVASVWLYRSGQAQEGELAETTSSAETNPFAEFEKAQGLSTDDKSAGWMAEAPTSPQSFTSNATATVRQRIADTMARARAALQKEDATEAKSLALAADSLAQQYKITFNHPSEDPAKLLVALSEANENPFAGGDGNSQRRFAQHLMDAAKDYRSKGNVAAARQKLMQAKNLDLTYSPFDETPDQLLAQLDQSTADPFGSFNNVAQSGAAPMSEIKRPVDRQGASGSAAHAGRTSFQCG